jgi:hypothetical protein
MAQLVRALTDCTPAPGLLAPTHEQPEFPPPPRAEQMVIINGDVFDKPSTFPNYNTNI